MPDTQNRPESRREQLYSLLGDLPPRDYPITATQINALIAPRAHLSLAGNDDRLTPPAGLDRIDRELRQVYAEAGAPDAWQLRRWDIGHFETHAMRAEIVAFLRQWL